MPLDSPLDRGLHAVDHALRTIWARHTAQRPCPTATEAETPLSEAERREAAALMRVNHVGEVCAQALYQAQALATKDAALRAHFEAAARDETDHLAWCEQRLVALGGRPSLLNPIWYAGAFGLGLLAGRAGDRASLGFVAETERQVEQHLDGHLDRLPAGDTASRAVVQQMRDDEVRHAREAEAAGGTALPAPLRWAMRGAAKVMTFTAHRI